MLEHDEELSYIFYMKYLNVVDMIRTNASYQKEKQFIMQMLGTNAKQMRAVDNAERLQNSLLKRYKILANNNERALKELNEIEMNHNRNRDTSEIDRGQSPSSSSSLSSMNTSITSKDLYDMINNTNLSMLILDCRPRDDYEKSKIRYNFCINIPEEILRPG